MGQSDKMSQSEKLIWLRLNQFLRTTTEKVNSESLRKSAAALNEALPDAISILRELIQSPELSAAQRLQCVEIILRIWQKAVEAENAFQTKQAQIARYRSQQAASQAQKRLTQLEAEKTSLATTKEQRRKDREDVATLKKVEAELKEKGITV